MHKNIHIQEFRAMLKGYKIVTFFLKQVLTTYKCGDMKYKGVQYQIKFERATLTTEKQINRLIKTA